MHRSAANKIRNNLAKRATIYGKKAFQNSDWTHCIDSYTLEMGSVDVMAFKQNILIEFSKRMTHSRCAYTKENRFALFLVRCRTETEFEIGRLVYLAEFALCATKVNFSVKMVPTTTTKRFCSIWNHRKPNWLPNHFDSMHQLLRYHSSGCLNFVGFCLEKRLWKSMEILKWHSGKHEASMNVAYPAKMMIFILLPMFNEIQTVSWTVEEKKRTTIWN